MFLKSLAFLFFGEKGDDSLGSSSMGVFISFMIELPRLCFGVVDGNSSEEHDEDVDCVAFDSSGGNGKGTVFEDEGVCSIDDRLFGVDTSEADGVFVPSSMKTPP